MIIEWVTQNLHVRQYVSTVLVGISTKHRHSAGTRWGVFDPSCICGWADITKYDAGGWWENTGKDTRKKVMLESLPESRRTENGWKMTWQFIPKIWSNRWKRFGLCHCVFSYRNNVPSTYWQERRWLWLLKLRDLEYDHSNLEIYSVENRNVM